MRPLKGFFSFLKKDFMFRKIELEGKIYYVDLEQFSDFFEAVTNGDFEYMLSIASVVLQTGKGFDIIIKNNQIPLDQLFETYLVLE